MNVDVDAIWAKCMEGLRGSVPPDAFANWFVPIRAVKISGRDFYLSVPGEVYKNEIESHYSSIIFPLLRQYFRPDAAVRGYANRKCARRIYAGRCGNG